MMHFHIVSSNCFYFKTILFNIIIYLDFLPNINIFFLPTKQKVMLVPRERISQSFLLIQMVLCGPIPTCSCHPSYWFRWVLCEPIADPSCHPAWWFRWDLCEPIAVTSYHPSWWFRWVICEPIAASSCHPSWWFRWVLYEPIAAFSCHPSCWSDGSFMNP